MANYNVDIAVAIKNAQALKKFNKDVKQTSNFVDDINLKIRRSSNAYEKSLNTLSSSLQKTKVNINKAAVGTDAFRKSALDLVRAEKSLNKELALKNKLLEQLRKNEDQFGVAQSSSSNRVRRNVAASAKSRIDPKFKSLSLLGQTSPVGQKIERTLALKRDEIRLQEALLSLEQRSAAKQNEKLQIQGELNRQTALAVNNAKLRGQSSPLTSDVRGNIYDVKSRIEGNTLASRRAKFRNIFSGVSGRDFGQLGGRIGPVQPVRSEGGFLAFSKAADKITDKHLKNIDKKVGKIAAIQTQQQTQKAFSALPGGDFGISGGQIGPRLPIQNRLGFGKNAQGGPFAMPGGAMGRVKGGLGSAMIGGGFPLLFGAGGLSSVMGGIGGAVGGALAPGGGFALSIAATALASQIEKVRAFRKEVRKLNEDVSSMGIESEFSRKQIKDLAKEFDITNQEAIKLAATFKTFGADQAGTLLSAFGSREVFDSLSGLKDTESVLGKIQELSGNISEETRRQLLQTLATKGPLEAQLQLQQEIINVRRKAVTDQKIKDFDFNAVFKDSRGKYKRAYDTEIERQEFRIKLQERFNEEFDDTNLTAEELLENQIKINEQMQFLAEFNAPTDQLRELMNPMRTVLDLSKEIKIGFEDSFKGIIRGTMSVSDAFRSMLNRIADYFLDTAAQLLALQVQKGFLGLFSNMFNFGGDDLLSNSGLTAATPGEVTMDNFANGGRPAVGRASIVGERGPELFVPDRAGTIIPNHAMGGSTNIVVNVDASGSNVEGDEQGGRELGRLISVAIQSELVQQKRPGGLLA